MTSGAGPARAVRAVPIVVLDEGVQGRGPGLLALPRPRVLPLLRERPVHPLDLAVLPGAERPRVLVSDSAGVQRLVELAGAVGRPIVGHDPLDRDAEPLEERQRAGHEAAGGPLPLVGQQLGVGGPAAVVDGHVQAGPPGPVRRRGPAAPRPPSAPRRGCAPPSRRRRGPARQASRARSEPGSRARGGAAPR